MKNTSICLLVWVLAVGCNKECRNYPYKDNLLAFLKKEYNYDPTARPEELLVMLPLNSCNPCLAGTVNLLNNNKDKDFVLYLGGPEKLARKYDLQELLTGRKVIYDTAALYEKYEIGMQVPFIIRFKQDRCIFYATTTSNNLDKIRTYLEWN